MRIILHKVRDQREANDLATKITLYRDAAGHPRGWFLGPLRYDDGRIELPYLPRSEAALASVAVVRGIEAARAAATPVCVIDPEDVWDRVWAD